MSARAWRSLALDLGSTRLKLAALDSSGALSVLASIPAPRTSEHDLECEFDAEEFDAAVGGLLQRALELAGRRLPLGVACQRSSFLAWDAAHLRPLTPVLSWRDRRAHAWCEEHAASAPWIESISGLRLSPHYLGPKLALLARAGLFRPDARREVRIGTLESFVIARRRPPDEEHVTDTTMAARSLLFDVRAGAWDARALEWVGAPRQALPRVLATFGRAHALHASLTVSASLSDQAAAYLCVARPGADAVLVNLGTGGFVLREVERFEPRRGYLCGPLLQAPDGARRFALEGTINAGAATLERIGGASAPPPERDPQPESYCAPEAGVGAPHWRAELALTCSTELSTLDVDARRRAFLEGLVFRVREIVDDLDPGGAATVLLSGGLANDAFVAPALACVLGRPLERLAEHESTLLGAARLAAGWAPFADPPRSVVAATAAPWLRAKYVRWRAWRDAWLARSSP